jgi:hypothetical protein
MPKDKAGYDIVYVVVDRLSKQAILVPCYKTVTAEDIARLYIDWIYWYFGPLSQLSLIKVRSLYIASGMSSAVF